MNSLSTVNLTYQSQWTGIKLIWCSSLLILLKHGGSLFRGPKWALSWVSKRYLRLLVLVRASANHAVCSAMCTHLTNGHKVFVSQRLWLYWFSTAAVAMDTGTAPSDTLPVRWLPLSWPWSKVSRQPQVHLQVLPDHNESGCSLLLVQFVLTVIYSQRKCKIRCLVYEKNLCEGGFKRNLWSWIGNVYMYKGLSSTKVPHPPLSDNIVIFSSHDRPLLTHYRNTKCQRGQYM